MCHCALILAGQYISLKFWKIKIVVSKQQSTFNQTDIKRKSTQYIFILVAQVRLLGTLDITTEVCSS